MGYCLRQSTRGFTYHAEFLTGFIFPEHIRKPAFDKRGSRLRRGEGMGDPTHRKYVESRLRVTVKH